MSTGSRRLVAAAVAAIIAVLTGIAVGLVSPQVTCRDAGPAGRPAATPTHAAGLGGADGQPDSGPTAAGDANDPTASQSAASQSAASQSTTSLQQGQPAQAALSCSVDRFESVPALVGLGGGLAAGAAAFVLLLMGRRTERPHNERPHSERSRGGGSGGGTTVPVPGGRPRHRGHHTGPRTGDSAGERTTAELSAAGTRKNVAEADRAALVRACIYVRDRTTSRALADRLGTALLEAGVRTVEPAGARFDPAQHEAGGAAPSGDPAKIGMIAAVEVPGYADRDGRLLRVPVVTVYRAGTGNEREDR